MTNNKHFLFWLPNFITALNLICGSIAVLLGVQGYIEWAACLIVVASVFDFLDGMAARLLHSYSNLGKELDSLCDLVSFGLAPASIMFTIIQLALFSELRFIFEIQANFWQWVIIASCLLIPVAGAFRLAKFNIDTRQSNSFLGLPIPANALFFASLAIVLTWGNSDIANEIILNKFNLMFSVILFPSLMISEVPMFSLKVKNFSWEDNKIRYIFISISIILLIAFKVIAFPLILLAYILISILGRNI